MSNDATSNPTAADLRQAAEKRIRAKRDFWGFVGVYVLVTLITNAVWFLTSRGYYWPGWQMFAMAIPLLISAFNAYGPGRGPITESQIEREMRKMQ